MATMERISSLQTRHDELEAALHVEHARAAADDFEVQRLKREKLKIKDEIRRLSS